MPRIRLPFGHPPTYRDPTRVKDARIINAFLEQEFEQGESHFIKRPGIQIYDGSGGPSDLCADTDGEQGAGVPGTYSLANEIDNSGWIPWFTPDQLDGDAGGSPGHSIEFDIINNWWRCDTWENGPGHLTAGWRFKNLGSLDGLATGIRAHIYAYPYPPVGNDLEFTFYKDPVSPDIHSTVGSHGEVNNGPGPTIEGIPTNSYNVLIFPIEDLIPPPTLPPLYVENNDFLRIVSFGLFSVPLGGVCFVTSIEIYIP